VFSAFEIFRMFGLSRLSSLRRARAFPALPPLYPRLGYSRSLPLQGTGVPGLVPRLGRSRPYPSIRVRPFPALSPSFIPEISTAAETAHHGPRPFERAARRGPPTNRLTPLPRPTPRLHVRVKPRVPP